MEKNLWAGGKFGLARKSEIQKMENVKVDLSLTDRFDRG